MATLSGKKVLMVIAPEQFRDEELAEPKAVLEKAGAAVTIASSRKGTATGMLGATANPTLLVQDARPRDYDAIVVVGGMGSPEHLWPDPNLHRLLTGVRDQGGVVGGICLSGAALARAGVLKGLEATVYSTPESLDEMKKGGAKYVKRDVVTTGKVVTAEGPHAARKFGEALVAALTASAPAAAPAPAAKK
jgi:protease I